MMKNLSLGSWITSNNISVVETMCMFPFEWLCIDLEHTANDYNDLLKLIITIQARNKKAYVRVGSNDSLIIKRALDIGADGIIVPMIKNIDDAKKSIESIYYPPVGKRGVGLFRAQGYGFHFENY
jgi:2-dehydro-3-deoxyglucarate aldolase